MLMMGSFSLFVAAAVLVFNLYLLVRPQYIQRCAFVLIGLAAVGLVVLGSFFQAWNDTWARVLVSIFSLIGALVGLGAAPLAACKSDDLSCCKPSSETPPQSPTST